MKNFLFVLSLFVFSQQALAHVTANPDNGLAGEYFQTSFRISHGCKDGAGTTSVRVEIPPGFVTLKPQYKPGWTVEIKKRKLAKSVSAGHGKQTDEEFSEVIWHGGPLPDDQYDEFGLLLKLPAKSQKLWFPVTQTCHKQIVNWDQIPSANEEWHEIEHPAPFVIINENPAANQSKK